MAAQLEQLGNEQQKIADAAEKKAEANVGRMVKARDALLLFGSEDVTPGKDDYKSIIMFLLPRIDSGTAPSKLGSRKKMKEKLAELENKYNKPWIELVKDEIAKAEVETELAAQEADTDVAVSDKVTEKVWEDLEIDREAALGNDELKDLDPITQAEM